MIKSKKKANLFYDIYKRCTISYFFSLMIFVIICGASSAQKTVLTVLIFDDICFLIENQGTKKN